jgi:hypothetical protein
MNLPSTPELPAAYSGKASISPDYSLAVTQALAAIRTNQMQVSALSSGFCKVITGFDGVLLAHELARLGRPVPLVVFVIDLGFRIDPHLAARLSCRDITR